MLTLLAAMLLWILPAFAAPASAVPVELAPWVPWVLEKHPELACASVAGSPACVWPGALSLEVTSDGGRFSLAVAVDNEVRVDLPGGDGAWPQGVTVDGRAAPVIADGEGHPALMLAAGEHRIVGAYVWPSMPQGLALPPLVAMIDLRVDGAVVAFPRLEADGTLRLGAGDQRAPEENRLDIGVSRRVDDGVPVSVTTRINLRAAGSGREMNLGQVLLANTRPVSLEADLPARVAADGSLIVQVRPGTYTITIQSLHDGPASALTAPTLPEPWPSAEVWVVGLDDRVRAVNLGGAQPVDPARTLLAEDWRGLPTFMVEQGVALTFDELRRGEPEPPPNQLTLRRELWLDMDGDGLTARDTFNGSIAQGWRLDMPAPGELGHVSDHGADQVITAYQGGSGVELRQSALAMIAESRFSGRPTAISAVGWSADVQSLSATLNLPPGWTLWTATGVDHVNGALLDEWTLLDLFFVLVVALAVGRLFGARWGLLALVALTLSRQEAQAPAVSWVLLLAVAALSRVIREGRIALVLRWLRYAVVLGLLLVLLPFSVTRVRTGFFPALERPWQGAYEEIPDRFVDLQIAPPSGAAGNGQAAGDGNGWDYESGGESGNIGSLAGLTRGGRADKQLAKGSLSLQVDPSAVVQTGPGVPTWRWNSVRLDWTGPVDAGAQLQLWLVGPFGNLILALGQVALLVALALKLAGLSKRNSVASAGGGAAGLMALVMTGLALTSQPARAAPSSEILTELENRLSLAPDCAPQCVAVASESLVLGDRLRIDAEVSAEALSSWPVPGPASAWVPATVSLDGKPTAAIARLSDGFLHVRVPPGVHRVSVEGPLPAALSLTLQFGLAPKHLDWRGEGWTLDGVRANGSVESAVQITRAMEGGDGGAQASAENLSPWLELRRTLDLGIPWRVRTELVRVGKADRPLSLRVPLLPGEAVTDAAFEVKDGAVLATLSADQTEVSWLSTLAESNDLSLTAPSGVPWTEQWTLLCSPIFSCRAEGPAPLRHTDIIDGAERWAPQWRPWPGETVKLTVTRPDAVPGQTVTVDQADLRYTPGRRLSEASLTLSVRTSQGGQQSVRLPEGSKLQSVQIDGQARPIQLRDGVLPVPLKPGSQQILLSWQQPAGRSMGVWDQVPAVEPGSPVVNTSTTIVSPEDRWTLMLTGPSWGPKPLLWSTVLVILGAAFLLARLPFVPLSAGQWALLGLGMTQVSPPEIAGVVLWFVAIGWRRAHPMQRWWTFSLGQLVLLGWTLIATGFLVHAVKRGLLNPPDMDIQGGGSSGANLVWYADRVTGTLPQPGMLSLPMLAWRVAMLAWALWLASLVVRQAAWAWRAFSTEGLWKWPVAQAKVEVPKPDLSVEQPPGE